jgi:hypothetical protein
MWRAFFMAIGISLCLIGVECMVVDKAVLADRGMEVDVSEWAGLEYTAPSQNRSIEPPEWAPWSFVSAGTVVLLYSLFLRTGGGGA